MVCELVIQTLRRDLRHQRSLHVPAVCSAVMFPILSVSSPIIHSHVLSKTSAALHIGFNAHKMVPVSQCV